MLCVIKVRPGVFYLQLELSEHSNKGTRLVFHVSDVGDCEGMQSLVAEHGPEVVFHAAAYKHVPVMEGNATRR